MNDTLSSAEQDFNCFVSGEEDGSISTYLNLIN